MKIVGFDCAKTDEPRNPTVGRCAASRSSSSNADALGIRGWNSGGPEGSVWNAGDLACHARVEVPCDGAFDVGLKVGRTELVHVTLAKASGGLDCSFTLSHDQWSAELDRAGALPFQTGIFRVEAYVICRHPPTLLRADDHFVAGFASGE